MSGEQGRRTDATEERRIVKALVYGSVNALMAIPVLYGYAAIIFRHEVFAPFMPALTKLIIFSRHEVFAPFMPALTKLIIFSSMVHQIVFSIMSTLPFAIGQVQDAGLIFMARMTTDVAERVMLRGGGADEVVATAVATTAIATASLGVVLVVAGKVKLTKFVAYLPMPVVGGYLAFIGFFCLEAGMSLSSTKQLTGVSSWVLLTKREFLLCVPCLACGVLWSWVSRTYNHFAVLPLSMVAVPALFFVALWASGQSMQDARDFGLIGPVSQPARLSEAYNLFEWKLVEWSVLPELLPVWVGMLFVVAFSSTLDVAAIEIDMGEPLEADKELQTVGWANFLSGFTGGFTGSYIFSQTMFSRRANCDSRLMGWVVTLVELAVCLVTVDPLGYIPLAFFAATLTFIAVDLMFEWLWEIREKLLDYEYMLLLVTFVAIQVVGLNMGLMIGISASIAKFVFSYASERRNTIEMVTKRGWFIRPAWERQYLELNRKTILCVELRGEIFFGSARNVFDQMAQMLDPRNKASRSGEEDRTPAETVQLWCGWAWKALRKRGKNRENSSMVGRSPRAMWYGAAREDEESLSQDDIQDLQPRFRFMVLDCSRVTNIDASAARTCFLPLQRLAEACGTSMAYAGLTVRMETLLRNHKAIGVEDVVVFSGFHQALDWCETMVVNYVKSSLETNESFGTNRSSVQYLLTQILDSSVATTRTMDGIERYCFNEQYEKGSPIFTPGEAADCYYVVTYGQVLMETAEGYKAHKADDQVVLGIGAVFGYVDFQLEQPRGHYAMALENCILAVFTRPLLDRMLDENPRLLCALERSIMLHLAQQLSDLPV